MASLLKLLGFNLKRLRALRGMSQDTLAEVAKTSREHIAKLETGRTWISVDMADKIAEVLKCQPSDLLRDPDYAPDPREAWLSLGQLLGFANPGATKGGSAISPELAALIAEIDKDDLPAVTDMLRGYRLGRQSTLRPNEKAQKKSI